MRSYADCEQQIARRTIARRRRLTLAANAHLLAIVDTRGNADGDRFRLAAWSLQHHFPGTTGNRYVEGNFDLGGNIFTPIRTTPPTAPRARSRSPAPGELTKNLLEPAWRGTGEELRKIGV